MTQSETDPKHERFKIYASILIATAPLFSVAAAGVLLKEPVRPALPGMLVALLGVAFVGLSLGVGGGPAALIVLLAAACQGLYHARFRTSKIRAFCLWK